MKKDLSQTEASGEKTWKTFCNGNVESHPPKFHDKITNLKVKTNRDLSQNMKGKIKGSCELAHELNWISEEIV